MAVITPPHTLTVLAQQFPVTKGLVLLGAISILLLLAQFVRRSSAIPKGASLPPGPKGMLMNRWGPSTHEYFS